MCISPILKHERIISIKGQVVQKNDLGNAPKAYGATENIEKVIKNNK